MTGYWEARAKAYEQYVGQRQAEIDAEMAAEDAAAEEYDRQRQAEIEAGLDEEEGPEPYTTEWYLATGNYVDPEPDWDAGEPYLDHAYGVAYYDTVAAMEAGRELWPEYRHVPPEPESAGEPAARPAPSRADPDPWACAEMEAGS